ncbi:MAG: hypothetical protein OXQ29_02520 [Rhodospirillaceae bacterium]|nr:hypothetical protein [Rhodospirillaceae bacterium]
MLTRAYRRSASLSKDSPAILESLHKGREVSVLGEAGLLMLGFRHYVFHGNEAHPEPHDFRSEFRQMLDGGDCLSEHAYRLATFTRLTLHVIQALVQADLKRDAEAPVSDMPFLSSLHDHEFDISCKFALNLTSYWPDGSTAAYCTPAEIEYLADGCNVLPAILEVMVAADSG